MILNLEQIPTSTRPDAPCAPITLEREKSLSEKRAIIENHRPQRALDRLKRTQKMTALQRIDAVLDENTWRLKLAQFVGFDEAQAGESTYAAGVFCVLGTVCDRHVLIIANDNTQNAGAWVKGAPEKIERAQKTAMRLRIPILWLIECPGLFLPTQEATFAGETGAGGIFAQQIRHSRASLVQLAAVFGDCVAGGGYLPIFCDRVLMTEHAAICIGGAALNKFSKAGQVRPGGTETHVHGSGCADERLPDDLSACLRLRELVSLLPSNPKTFYRLAEPLEPLKCADDLYSLIPPDTRKPFDIRDVLARLADASLAELIDPDDADGIYACHALVSGFHAIFIANQPQNMGSILTRNSIEKMTRIVLMARTRGIPVIWFQDVSGFDIGAEAERQGLLRYGAELLNALTQNDGEMPQMTILLRKASGAGYYAMKGRPFGPALIVATALTKLEVMSPEVLASTLYDAKIQRAQDDLSTIVDNSAQDLSTTVDNEEKHRTLKTLKARKQALLEHQNHESCIERAEARGDIDAILDLRDLRKAVVFFVEAAWQSPPPHSCR